MVVVEPASHPLLKVLGPEVAQGFTDLHRRHGVDLRLGTGVRGVGNRAGAPVLALEDGSTVDADALVVGIGAAPAESLAAAAGLRVDNGVVVDAALRSSHPDVLAAGDVANAHHPRLGRHLRVEHWDNAIHQGRAAARSILGEEVSYDRLRYFFSDQYDLGMEYVGHAGPDGYDEVVLRGDLSAMVFTALWLRDGAVLAGMQANDWDATGHLRRVLDAEHLDLEQVRDTAVPLDRLAR